MKVIIASAWPYANGSLHIGHLAALLPGDVLARYHRAKGDKVYYVSGSDCHGTPVSIRAQNENKTPYEVSDKYHDEFAYCFSKLGFSYDKYGKTSSEVHKNFVTDFHREMYRSKYIFEKAVPQAYCSTCNRFLADRFVTGTCPGCGKKSRGDQCDFCGIVIESEQLINPECTICNNSPEYKSTKHLFIKLSEMKEYYEEMLKCRPNWRKNAISFTKRYLEEGEGLRDRAITRDLDWGIDSPVEGNCYDKKGYDKKSYNKMGYEGKKIYIWAENVLGYLSMVHELCERENENVNKDNFYELWNGGAKTYFVHGKDNIPFHTIILPALLKAHGGYKFMPDEIISSEFMTLEGKKISTSNDWAVWLPDIVDKYNPDSIRYFFMSNGPERKDGDFTWNEFINVNNGELLGAWGNLVNRTLVFAAKNYDRAIPQGKIDVGIEEKLASLFDTCGELIQKGEFRECLSKIFSSIRETNKYFDDKKPWITIKENRTACCDTIFNCINAISAFAVLLNPFLPFTSEKIMSWLKLGEEWEYQRINSGGKIGETSILFERLEKNNI